MCGLKKKKGREGERHAYKGRVNEFTKVHEKKRVQKALGDAGLSGGEMKSVEGGEDEKVLVGQGETANEIHVELDLTRRSERVAVAEKRVGKNRIDGRKCKKGKEKAQGLFIRRDIGYVLRIRMKKDEAQDLRIGVKGEGKQRRGRRTRGRGREVTCAQKGIAIKYKVMYGKNDEKTGVQGLPGIRNVSWRRRGEKGGRRKNRWKRRHVKVDETVVEESKEGMKERGG